MNKQRENLYKIDNNLYLVTSQAGFNQVQKILSYEGFNIGHPESYPSVVTSYERYLGYHKTIFVCTPLNDYIKKRQDILSKIIETDRLHST